MTNSIFQNLVDIIKTAMPPAFKTIRWLLSLMIPISLLVTILQYYGIIGWIADLLNPAFALIGLSGQCAFVFLTSIFLNIYSAIAVISSLPLSMREITILAVMCLISHNMIIETIIQMKTGSSGIQMVLVRISSSILCAFILNLILKSDSTHTNIIYIHNQSLTLLELLKNWIINIFHLSIKVMVFVSSLMILQKLLEKSGIIEIISKILAPVLRIMGLPTKTSFLWIVSNVLGFAYSSAIIFDELEKGKLTKNENNLLNYHVAISHSLLEDTLLFFAIGVSIFWLIFPRIILAIIVVWLYRLLNYKKFEKH